MNWLLGADHSPIETTIAYEQVAIEATAAVAQTEPDPYFAQVYRYSALLDRLEGKDANNILQSYTDILAGRPTAVEHRAPEDDLREPYDCQTADPLARQLYAEIALIEEQHVTQYGFLIDPSQSILEQ